MSRLTAEFSTAFSRDLKKKAKRRKWLVPTKARARLTPGAAYAVTTCESVSSATAKRAQSIFAVRFMNLIPRMNISVQNSALVLKGGCNAQISCLQNAGKAAEEAGWTTFIRARYHWTKGPHRKTKGFPLPKTPLYKTETIFHCAVILSFGFSFFK